MGAGWRGRAALGAAMMAFAGCSAGAIESEESGTSPVIHGEPDIDEHDSVVLLLMRFDDGFVAACTGTMVAPNLVLTARHCVSKTEGATICTADGTPYPSDERVGDTCDPKNLVVYTGRLASEKLSKGEQPVARGKRIFVEGPRTLCDGDVAFVLLDRPVDVAVAPIRLGEGPREGESLTVVGWGLTEAGAPNERMKRDGVKVARVGPLVFDESTRWGIGPSEFLAGEGNCSGDSGGPAFATTGAVVGVVSRGGNGRESTSNPAENCIGEDTIVFYTHLANKASFVRRAFEASGYAPREEGAEPGKTKGSTCSQDAECSSNACIEGVCTTRCDHDEQCRDGEVCAKKRGIGVCAEPPPESPDDPERPKGPKRTRGPGAEAAPTTTTTTITRSACNAAPGAGGSTSHGFALAAIALGAARRRR